jgi:very-short-patch-repair endonuclease
MLEVRFARLCRRAGLPLPVFQYELRLNGAVRRVDFAFPDLQIAIEVDGFQVRTDRDVFQQERRRQNDFSMGGWTILRFTWHDITKDATYVVRQIQTALLLTGRHTE